MPLNIPNSDKKRLVIVGGGFAGLQLAKQLRRSAYQVVLLDRHNFHQFQPLFYQVAMSGLEPSSISFPLRKLFQKSPDVHIRVAEVQGVDIENRRLHTDGGTIYYHFLVLAMGATTNFYGMTNIERQALTLKSVSEALHLRNKILADLEEALKSDTMEERQKFIDIAIVGGGPTGVELAGSLAEMKRYILPKEYGEFDANEVDIYLIQANRRLLPGMSEEAGEKSLKYLKDLGVDVLLHSRVKDYDGQRVFLSDGREIEVGKLIWAAGIRANGLEGLPEDCIESTGRLCVDKYNRLIGTQDVFVIGDQCMMKSSELDHGHPQVAQVAIQQGRLLAKNLKRMATNKDLKSFHYIDKGTLATVGRNKAVADLPKLHFGGFMAWVVWLFVHLFALIGTKNKIFVFFNWVWNYFTYDQSLRLIIKPYKHEDN